MFVCLVESIESNKFSFITYSLLRLFPRNLDLMFDGNFSSGSFSQVEEELKLDPIEAWFSTWAVSERALHGVSSKKFQKGWVNTP